MIVGGLGKSGHIGRKIAATFASTGTTATFLHLAEAIHGDLGIAATGDVALLISQSGATAELEPVIEHFEAIGIPIIAITGNPRSMLGEAATAPLVLPHWPEVGPGSGGADHLDDHDAGAGRCAGDDGDAGEGLYPHRLRPAASRRLARRAAEAGAAADARRRRRCRWSARTPTCTTPSSTMCDKRLGVVGVTDDGGNLVGVITDGDLRRHIEQGLDHPASVFMTANPKTIGAGLRWSTRR